MKNFFKISLVILFFAAFCSCSKDDAPEQQVVVQPEPINQAPSQFNLIAPEADAQNIDVSPTFNWEAAVDSDGDQITYEIYADTTSTPSTLIGTTTETSFEPQERLSLLENYNWRVTASDDKGGESESDIHGFDTRNIQFSNVTQSAAFQARREFASTLFNDKVWISGGTHNTTADDFFTNDIWNSEDGFNWSEVTTNAGWPKRKDHTMTAFQGKLWIIGGRNSEGFLSDVWSSEDGVSWQLETNSAGFGQISLHTTTVFNDKLFVIHNSKVWFSEDGIVWTLASEGVIGSVRKRHTALVFKNKLFVIGGTDNDPTKLMSSANGIDWEIVNDNPPYLLEIFERRYHSSVVFDDKLWVIGGFLSSNTLGGNDVWYSSDGVDWILASDNGAFSKRAGHQSHVLGDKIWVIGGESINGAGELNDVWFIN